MADTTGQFTISSTQMQAALATYLAANPVVPKAPTQAQVNTAVAAYLKGNPVPAGVTLAQVNEAIIAAIAAIPPAVTPPVVPPPVVTPPSGLPPLWNQAPPSGTCPAPNGAVFGKAGEFDTAPMAGHEIWDNFDGPAGSAPDTRLWLRDTTNQGGTQTYDPSHAVLDGLGHVALTATRDANGALTSGRFTSRTKWNIQNGWVAARIKFPSGDPAFFPAWWALFVGYNTAPNSYGEIDIMEYFGDTTKYTTTLHCGSSGADVTLTKAVPAGINVTDYHTYWMNWLTDSITFGVDDTIVGQITPASTKAWANLQQPFYLINNFAVAPPWLPAPVAKNYPAQMLTDWVWYKPL